MPNELTQFLVHVETYRPVVAAWERGDFSKTTSAINYPPGFNKYVCETFIRLKMHQAELLALPDVKTEPVNCDDLGKRCQVKWHRTQATLGNRDIGDCRR
jgi:hypothetical protein